MTAQSVGAAHEPSALSPDELAFVICVEATVLEAMGVTYVAAPLNMTGHPYGPINRIVVSAWAEVELAAPWLVVLDTDTVFVSEPSFARCDIGVRPVDMKGTASSGAHDPMDAYWSQLAEAAGVAVDDLPWLTASVSRDRVRASYNGGFVVARRALGVFQRTRDLFFQNFEAGRAPTPDPTIDIRASTGEVGLEASRWWGSSQASLSIAIWSSTRDVRLYDARYNIPLHLMKPIDWPLPDGAEPVLLHYHHLLERPNRLRAYMAKLQPSVEAAVWMRKTTRPLAIDPAG
ncbi:MAG: hypothetical protein EON88_05665 [Brevundimonas sp.]|nr:MAG: hypothetical protein EON88_05665 [Brevundimonas sp.]